MASLGTFIVLMGRLTAEEFFSFLISSTHKIWSCRNRATVQCVLSLIGSYSRQLSVKVTASVPKYVKILIFLSLLVERDEENIEIKVVLVSGFKGYQLNYLVCSAALFA